MMDTPFVEKAIPMVSVDENTGKYVVTPTAINFLKAISGPIAVVSVAGLYRTGKSYLLNRVLLNRSNGFGVGPTVNPCTKGLWCWGTPIKGTTPEGQAVNIIVIDTEGIGALDEDQTHDTKIFTLAILASSCFIYNSVGSIDETAIQNLSLVVNLTKHIQLKATSPDEEGEDPDEIASYFPTFYWVVRDFSLQLQDPEGNTISSKEYLERALAPQNGFSDDIQEKNRIRRLLSAFFKDRDCYTMIRPLVDETKLQNLDKMDYDELRPEFVQQAMSFRKKIISGVKSKTLQNQKLNGTLYCSMITSYVKAINEGAVPNIENAWSYMCEEQCNRAFEECFEIYGNAIQDGLRDLPRSEQDFIFHTSEAEQKALQAYRSKALGDHAPNGLKQLKKRIRTHIAELKEENIKESSKQLRDYIVKNAALITKKLNSQQYSSYTEYQKEIVALGEKFNKQGPKLHNHRYTYIEAIRKLSAQGAEFLFKNFTKSQEKTMEMFKEKEKQMTENMNNLKEEYERLRKNYSETVTEADHKLVELNNREQTLKKQLQITMHLKEEEDKKRERDFDGKYSDFKAKYRTLEEKFLDLTNRFEENVRTYQMDQKKWQKEKAVLEQKVSLNQTQIDELKSKEKSLDANLNISKANMSKEVRDISLRFEKEREELRSELNIKSQKLNETSEELNSVKEQLSELNQKSQKKQSKLKEDYNSIKKQMERLKQNMENQRKQMREEWNRTEQKLINERQATQEQLRQHERVSQQREQYLQKQVQEAQIQCSTIEQQFVYAKSQNNSLKSKVNEMKESYQLALSNYEATLKESNEETFTQRMLEISRQHKCQIEKINENFEVEKERESNKYLNLLKTFEELQKNYNTLTVQKMQREGEMKSMIEDLRKSCMDASAQKLNLQTYLKRNIEDLKMQHQMRIQEVKNEFQEYKEKASREYEQIVNDTNLKIGQLGNLYSLDCEKLQKNILFEKDRAAREQQKRIEELESKYEQERDRMIEDYEDSLANYINECEQYKKTVGDLQHINEMQAKEIAKLEQINKELKDIIDKKTVEFNDKEAKMITEYKQQKSKLQSKLEAQIISINEKEKENVTLRHENSQIVSGIEKKEAVIRQMDSQLKESESKYNQEKERITNNLKEKEKEFNEKISNASQENALVRQQIDYETKRSKQLQEKLKELSLNTENKFNEMKASKEEEMKLLMVKYTTEKAMYQAKLQELKKSEKEMQTTLKKELNQLRTDNALFFEKLSNTEARLKESETIRNEEIGSLRQQLSRVKQSANNKQKELSESLKQTKARLEAISNQKMSLNMLLQKERVLNQKSTEMLQKTKEEAKKEYQDRLNVLQTQLTNQRNIRFNDKSSLDSNYRSMITSMENEYKQKNQSLIDTLNRVKNQYENLKFNSQKEIKTLVQNYEQDKNQRMIDFGNLERKFNEISEKERVSTTELAKILKERDGRVDQILKKEASERDTLKRKLVELETRLKENQTTNMNNNLLIEKERSKWGMEKSELSEKLRDQIDYSKTMKQKAEKFKAEVDRLKNERKGTKTMHSQISMIRPSLNETKVEKTSVVEEFNKENSGMQ